MNVRFTRKSGRQMSVEFTYEMMERSNYIKEKWLQSNGTVDIRYDQCRHSLVVYTYRVPYDMFDDIDFELIERYIISSDTSMHTLDDLGFIMMYSINTPLVNDHIVKFFNGDFPGESRHECNIGRSYESFLIHNVTFAVSAEQSCVLAMTRRIHYCTPSDVDPMIIDIVNNNYPEDAIEGSCAESYLGMIRPCRT